MLASKVSSSSSEPQKREILMVEGRSKHPVMPGLYLLNVVFAVVQLLLLYIEAVVE